MVIFLKLIKQYWHCWHSFRYTKANNFTIYDDCPGCFIISRIIENTPYFIIRQSAIQYLQHTMTDKSRYIITMRNPTDRMISHYFYLHKQNVVSVFDFYQNLLTYPRKKLQKSFNIQEWILPHQRKGQSPVVLLIGLLEGWI